MAPSINMEAFHTACAEFGTIVSCNPPFLSMTKYNSSGLHVEEENSASVILLTVLVMSLYILAVVGLIRKHLKKVEAEEEKILLITKEGITEVSAESLEEAEGEALL